MLTALATLVGVPLALLVVPLSSSLLTEIARFRLVEDRRNALGAITRAAVLTALGAAVVVFDKPNAPNPKDRGTIDRYSSIAPTSSRGLETVFFPILIAWSVVDVISRSLFALGRPRAPIAAAALALVINVAFSTFAPRLAIHWIGAGAILGFVAAAGFMIVHLRRHS